MRKIQYSALGILIASTLTACHSKRNPNEIIVKKPVIVQPRKTIKMGDYEQTRKVEWLGTTYTIAVRFSADTSLPTASDGNQKYFDNQVQLRILRKDDSEFFNRTFTKADFESCLDESFRKNGALLGIVFNRTEDDNLYFAASVGSPDKSSDEYVPLVLRLSKTGKVTISKDNQLDTSSDVAPEKTPDDDDSV